MLLQSSDIKLVHYENMVKGPYILGPTEKRWKKNKLVHLKRNTKT